MITLRKPWGGISADLERNLFISTGKPQDP